MSTKYRHNNGNLHSSRLVQESAPSGPFGPYSVLLLYAVMTSVMRLGGKPFDRFGHEICLLQEMLRVVVYLAQMNLPFTGSCYRKHFT